MPYLILVTLLWAFSFSLIDEFLAGQVDSYFAVLTRVLFAALIFLPLTRWRSIPAELIGGVLLVGALQFGVTYVCLYRSFQYLSAPEVMLFTIMTPVFVTLLDDALQKKFTPAALLAAVLAVAGAAIIRYDGITGGYVTGFLLLQVSNASFAAGQVGYRYVLNRYPSPVPSIHFFGYFFLGALLVTVPAFLLFGSFTQLPETGLQWTVLAWLGFGASAAGLYLWNTGATRVDAGTLAVMNNAVIPAGLAINLLIWNRDADLVRLAAGAAVMVLAWWINRRAIQHREANK